MKPTIKKLFVVLLLAGGVVAAQDKVATPPAATDQVCTDKADMTRVKRAPRSSDRSGNIWYFNVPVATAEGTRVPVYLGEQDKVQIHICNNPFLYTYVLETPEAAIASDDVIGKFTSMLGLGEIPGKGTAPTTPAKKEGGGGSRGGLRSETGDTAFDGANASPSMNCAIADIRENADALNKAAVVLKKASEAADATALTKAGTANQAQLACDAKTYLDNRADFQSRFNGLLEDNIGGPNLKGTVRDLISNTHSGYNQLVDPEFENTLVINVRDSRRAAQDLDGAITKAGPIQDLIEAAVEQAKCIVKGVPTKQAKEFRVAQALLQPAIDAAKAAQKTADGKLVNLKSAVGQSAYNACVYQYRKSHEYQSIMDGAIKPLEAVLENPDNFESSRREGPFEEPTSVQIVLHRTPTDQKQLPVGSDVTANEAFTCEADADKVMKSNNAILNMNDVMKATGDEPAMTAAKDDSEKGKGDQGKGDKGKDDKKTTSEAIILTQPAVFGGPRLTLSGGLIVSGLANREYQRTASLDANNNSITVIDYKTNSSLRTLPMVFGNVRVARINFRGWNTDALYLSMGLTAHANDKGTSPEFFVGPSVSLAHNRFYLSAGTYIGKQQSLAGGLKVGQTLPSGFTSDLPLSNSYKPSWAFGISYRFNVKGGGSDSNPPKTEKPAKDASTPAKKK